MKYQDLKIRDAGRLAFMALAMAVVLSAGLYARSTLEGIMGRRYLPLLAALAFMTPVILAVCIYYLCSSPAQNARFLQWSERHRWGRPPLQFDWTLLDSNDLDYDVPTLRYLLAKKSGRNVR